MRRPSVVLLTDYGYQDHYAGVVKGVISSLAPNANIIDLSHGIEPQNVLQAAIELDASYDYFPKGTIFVAVVDPGVGTSRKIICLKTKKHYFLAPDNGLLTKVWERECGVIRQVGAGFKPAPTSQDKISNTFHGRDIFAPAAAALAKTVNPDKAFQKFGPRIKEIRKLSIPEAKVTSNHLTGEILFFDHFGNAVSNIHRSLFQKHRLDKILVFCGAHLIGNLSQTYGFGKKTVAVINSFGYLELAVPGGSTKQIFKKDAAIKIIFKP